MIRTRAVAFASLLLISACSHHTPIAIIAVVDTSASITPRAEKAALDALRHQIGRMQRGDRLIIIPISGDAVNDAGGHVLRLFAPTQRESYDTDLRRFEDQAQRQFTAWALSLDPHQSRTDILGTLDAAQQELASQPKESKRRLILVSDFVEDDGTFNFVSVPPVSTPARASQLATSLREQNGFSLQGASICLGRLESSDFASLSNERKEAVQAFWTSYFSAAGQSAKIQFDGTELLSGVEQGCSSGKP